MRAGTATSTPTSACASGTATSSSFRDGEEIFLRTYFTDARSRRGAGHHLSDLDRTALLRSRRVRRAISLIETVPQIAAMWLTDESHVRRVIHEFNERGTTSLDPDYRGGRPRRMTDTQRRRAVAVATA